MGRRHPLAFVLALAACAVLAGAKSLTAIAGGPQTPPPPSWPPSAARATEHGRDEIRRVKTATTTRGPGLPHALQAVRRRRLITTGKVTLERVYAVTDLTAELADAPEIAHRVREHWGIENKIHHVRDTTFAEDASRVRTGNASRAMAALRKLASAPSA